MKILRRLTLLVALLSVSVFTLRAQQDETITGLLVESTEFESLVAAVIAADLDTTLSDDGPFTVFAPTDDAFDDALSDLGLTLDDLAADPDTLTAILTYHVLPDATFASDVAALVDQSVTTVNGAELAVTEGENGPTLNDTVNLINTDIEVSNGVIHVIDAVLLPPNLMEGDALAELTAPPETGDEATPNAETTDPEVAATAGGTIVDIASRGVNLTQLVEALQATGLDETLVGEGPFTVFAPTDTAFEDAVAEQGLNLLADTDVLAEILTYHVVAGQFLAEDLVALGGTELETVNGATILISTEAGLTLNDGVEVIAPDVGTSNGVIHIINAVLLPPSGE